MQLFSILIRHCAPRDKKEAIVGYFLAKDDLVIYNYIDQELLFGTWTDRHNDSLDEPIITRDEDDYDTIIHTESYKEQMLRLRGEFNNPYADYSDAYYGVTHYGWTEGKEITAEQANDLIQLGIATVLN